MIKCVCHVARGCLSDDEAKPLWAPWDAGGMKPLRLYVWPVRIRSNVQFIISDRVVCTSIAARSYFSENKKYRVLPLLIATAMDSLLSLIDLMLFAVL